MRSFFRAVAPRAVAIAALALAGSAAQAAQVTLNFFRVTPANAPVNPAAQFTCVVSDIAPNMVNFRFTNSAAIASSISEIYYDDTSGPFVAQAAVLTQVGTNFSAGGASPGNLPGGSGVGFNATTIFSADAQGNPSNGIDTAADILDMKFTLLAGKSWADVVAALISGELRVGMHVRSIGQGGESDAFVNENPPPSILVPLPPAAAAGLSTLGALVITSAVRRRRNR